MKKWLTGRELKSRWGITPPTLVYWIKTTDLKAHWPNDFLPINDDTVSEYADLENYLDLEHERFLRVRTPKYKYGRRWPGFDKLIYDKDIVVSIEKEHDIQPTQPSDDVNDLDGKERQELGRLRKAKEKWDDSIHAAVIATQFCIEQNDRVTKKLLWDKLDQQKYGKIPNTVFEKIWKAIPQKYRNIGGAPKKKIKNS